MKAGSCSAGQEMPHLFIVFMTACHWILSWASWTQSKLIISLRPILILCSHLSLGCQISLFPSGLTNSMEQVLEKPSHSASQEIPYFLWNLMVHYHVHKILLLALNLSQMTPLHAIPIYFSKIHSNITFPSICLCLLSGLFPSGFLAKILYASVIYPTCATCPAHLSLIWLP